MKRVIARWIALGLVLTLCMAGVYVARAHVRITTDISWSKNVREILRENCMECHSPGGMAPEYIDLSIYGFETGISGARDWAQAVEEEIMTGRMPPWKADTRFEKFSNRRALTQEEIEIITTWAQGGGPQGPFRDLPTPEEFVDRDWELGEPDLVVQMPEPYVLGANDQTALVTVTVPIDLEEDRYLSGYEFFPGNRAIVHSILAFIRDPEGADPVSLEMEVIKEYDPLADEDDLEEIVERSIPTGRRFLGQWVRGDDPLLLPDEAGRLVRAGSSIELQVTYFKPGSEDTGEPMSDRTKLGLYFRTDPANLLIETKRIANEDFTIKAGERGYEVRASLELDESVYLTGVNPHMGLLGSRLSVLAHYPDGLTKTLLYVPEFKHKWNSSYVFESPVEAPMGTVIELIGLYDNSEDNFENPNYPPKDVKAGDAVTQERLVAYVDYYLKNHIFVPTPTPTPKPRVEGGGMVDLIGIDSDAFAPGDSFTSGKGGIAAAPDSLFPPPPPETGPDALVRAAVEAVLAATEIYWCSMRGPNSDCGVHEYHAPGKCPTCGMDLEPKSEILAKYKDRWASTEADYKLTRDGAEEIYWALDPQSDGNEILEFTSLEEARASGLDYFHKSRFERVREYIDLETKEIFYSPGLNPATMEPVQSTGHMDHNSVHGGLFFMADNNFHHVEGTLTEPGALRIYFYDDFKYPLDPRNFKARVVIERFNEETEEIVEDQYVVEHEFELDPYLTARIPEIAEWPAVVTAYIWLAGEEKMFDFPFDGLTTEPEPNAALIPIRLHSHADYKPPAIPEATEDIIREIARRQVILEARIAAEDWYGIHAPAFDTIEFAKALDREKKTLPAQKKKPLLDALTKLRTACDRLDRSGDQQRAGAVARRYAQYSDALEELFAIFPDAAAN